MASKGTMFCTQHSWLRVKEKMVKSAKKGSRRSGCFPSTGWISGRASVLTWKWSNQQKEVDVSQAQNGYILKDEAYWPVPSSCRAEALCCGQGQAGGADGGGCACNGRWYCAAFGPNLHKPCNMSVLSYFLYGCEHIQGEQLHDMLPSIFHTELLPF